MIKQEEELQVYQKLLKSKIKNEYIRQIIEEHLKWYIKKAEEAKWFYRTSNILIIILTAMIPCLNTIFTLQDKKDYALVGSTILALVVTVLTGAGTFFDWKTSWFKYRRTAEEMKTYIRQYIGDSIILEEKEFLSKIEQIANGEVQSWSIYMKEKNQSVEKPKEDTNE